MAKKKTAPRKKKKNTSRKIVGEPKKEKEIIPVSNYDPELCFAILDDEGQRLGYIEDKTSVLHRLSIVAQRNAFEKSDTDDNYEAEFARLLSQKYMVDVSDVVAYRILNVVYAAFAEEKKNTSG